MSELYLSETEKSPYRFLKLPDGTWISPHINTETFILKRAPNSITSFNRSILDIECHPLLLITYSEQEGKPLRFKGIGGTFPGREGHDKRMKVYYWDKVDISEYYQRFLSKKMDWEVFFRNERGRIYLYRRHTRGGFAQAMSASKFLDDNVLVIRLKMYWILRGIVVLKRLLSRCRLRREKCTLFIQATSWKQPKSGLSCFSGSVNGPITRRVLDYI